MKKLNPLTTTATGLAVGAVALAGALVPAGAQAAPESAKELGSTSLAEVLAADSGFDTDPDDFDILDAAVGAVLAAKPDSPVAILTRGGKKVTAFLPTDRAFKRLVGDLETHQPRGEEKTFERVANLIDIDTIEAVLLYHVVVGKTLPSPKVLEADGADITTANGATFRVVLKKGRVVLRDQDTDDRNPRAIADLLDINRGNKQVGHGISRVLRPVDL